VATFDVDRDGKLNATERRALVRALRKRLGIPARD
jgi:hypothetical protein